MAALGDASGQLHVTVSTQITVKLHLVVAEESGVGNLLATDVPVGSASRTVPVKLMKQKLSSTKGSFMYMI